MVYFMRLFPLAEVKIAFISINLSDFWGDRFYLSGIYRSYLYESESKKINHKRNQVSM